MKALVTDVVTRAGGELVEQDGVLSVKLPAEGPGDELAKRIGQHELRLVFEATRIGPGVDLVAPGSHVLRAIEEFLAIHGRRSWVEAPAAHKLAVKTVSAVVRVTRGATLALEGREADAGHDVYVVYRVRYRSLERTDAVECVRVRLRPRVEPVVERADPPDEVGGWETRPRKHLPAEQLEDALELADEWVVTRGRAEATRLEQEARRKSTRELSRLHAYYSGTIAELERSRRTEQAISRIEELEDERALRIHELASTTHVRVEVEPLQLLVVEVPLQTARLLVRRKDRETEPEEAEAVTVDAPPADAPPAEEPAATPPDGAPAAPAADAPPPAGLLIVFDRHAGELTLPPCPSCDGSLAGAVLDACATKHVVHQTCIDRCGRCAAAVCSACGARTCASCDASTCPACASTCPSCKKDVCADHRATCAICSSSGCAVCMHSCAECSAVVCEADGHVAVEGARAILCTRCATPCPGCKTATSYKELVRCGGCGRKFCPTCHPRDAGACVLCAGRAT